LFISRKGRNEKIVGDFMANEDMRGFVISSLLEDVYRQARKDIGSISKG